MLFNLPISEKFSHLISGKPGPPRGRPRGRGRPSIFADWEVAINTTTSGPHSKRGQQNIVYATRAIEILKYNGLEKFDFLFRSKSGKTKPKMTILAELGRINAKQLPMMAKTICDSRMTAGQAVSSLRNGRGANKSTASVKGMQAAMLAAMKLASKNYNLRHPTMSQAMIKEAWLTFGQFGMSAKP